MRLDHLLSTENTGHCLVAGASRAGATVASGVDAGVEEIMRLHGAGMLLGSRTATPQVSCGAVPMPMRSTRVPLGGLRERVARGGLRTG